METATNKTRLWTLFGKIQRNENEFVSQTECTKSTRSNNNLAYQLQNRYSEETHIVMKFMRYSKANEINANLTQSRIIKVI